MMIDPSTSTVPRRGVSWLAAGALAVVIAVLLSVPAAGNPGVRPAPTAASGDGAGAVTGTSAKPTTSTGRAGQQRSADPPGTLLPMVLAAILFLALLAPVSGFHWHGHWHSR